MRGKLLKFGIALACLALGMVSGVITYYYARPHLPAKISLDLTRPLPSSVPENDKPQPYPDWENRKRQRALAVILDNTAEARPQSGLDLAEVVLELPVEGGLTRLLAIISCENQELVGPIRSARPYLVDLAAEYNAILVHAGGSDEALEVIENSGIDYLDEITGEAQIGAAFWRVPERPKPHNLYASSDSLRRVGKSLKFDMVSPPPVRPIYGPNSEVTGEPHTGVTIFYPHRNSQVRYVFNKDHLVYERLMDGKPHLNSKGEQLTMTNVIVQFVPYRFIDGDGRIQLNMQGQGKALVFREGKVIEGLWNKNPGELTTFTDQKGKTLAMVPGPTWIQVVVNGTRVDY